MKNLIVIAICFFGLTASASAQCNRFLNYETGTQVGTSLANSESYCGEKENLALATYYQYVGVCVEYAGAALQSYFNTRGECGGDSGGRVNDDDDVCHATEEGHGAGCIEE
ncbi:hypothetical protein [Ekhidna sp.]|uniref:hypothetical protein n=1 Tax=Ekhidna sp. TaxID=2608089 RepID=UPI003BA8B4FE